MLKLLSWVMRPSTVQEGQPNIDLRKSDEAAQLNRGNLGVQRALAFAAKQHGTSQEGLLLVLAGQRRHASLRNWISSKQLNPFQTHTHGDEMMHRMRMDPMQQLNHSGASASKSSALRAMRVPKFLRSLYDILHYEDQSILTWSKDGAYFQIFDTKRLETAVLPKYFKHGKFASFQRQLNNFGFRKWTKTQSSVCTFSHHHLVRCHPQHLAEFISRRPPPNGLRPPAVDASSRRKRSFTELMRATDILNPVSVKTIKCEINNFNPVESNVCTPRWAIDPVGFLKAEEETNGTPTCTSSEQTFNFLVEELHDIILPVPAMSERHDSRSMEKMLELRMLNECLELGTAGTMYAATNHAGGELFPSLPYSWDSDTFFAPVGRTHFEQWKLQ